MSLSKSCGSGHDQEILSLRTRAMTVLVSNYSAMFHGPREPRLDLLPKELGKELFARLIRKEILEVPLLSRIVDVKTTILDLKSISGLDNKVVRILQGFKGLQSLYLYRVVADSSVLCAMFATMAKLSSLEMKNCPTFDDAVLSKIAECCPCLKILNATHSGITDKGMETLGLQYKLCLVALNISYTKVTHRGIKALACGPSRGTLKELKARGSGIKLPEEIVSAINEFTQLEEYDFDLGSNGDLIFHIFELVGPLKRKENGQGQQNLVRGILGNVLI